jgi:exopolysaccharide production protein ExoQ
MEDALQLTATTAQEGRGKALSLPGLIGFTFAFRACLTLLFFKDDPVHGTVVDVVLSLLAFMVAVLCYTGAPQATAAAYFKTATLRWIAASLAYCLISLSWSSAPLLSSAGYWVSWAADIAAVLLVLRYGPLKEQASSLMKGFVIGASFVAVVAWSIPTTIDLRLGDEDFLHPNVIGRLFSIAALLAIYFTAEDRRWQIPAFGLSFTVLRTLSKTSIIAFIAALACYFIRGSKLTRATKIKIGVLTTAVLASFWGILETYLDAYTATVGPETLTGRTLIWSVSAEYAMQKPWLGYGFYSYRIIVPRFGSFEAWQAHNELLQQFFSFGIFGLILVIGIYATFYWQIRHSRPGQLNTLVSALLVFALVRGITDAEIYDLSLPLWLMATLSVLLSSAQTDSQTTAPPALEPSLPAQTPLQ